MLKLKLCIDECGIQQKDLVTATGWSKTQFSITLNTGRLPVNADEFRADVTRFVVDNKPITSWLHANGLQISDLFLPVSDCAVIAELPGQNDNGEIPGCGPAWSCDEYGRPGHDYQYCRNCHRRYEGHLQRAHGRAAVMATA